MTSEPFRVWAPAAGQVTLVADGGEVPMAEAGGGWWAAPAPDPLTVVRYGFRLDGGQVRPDPRSPWQPDGVRGLSRPVDHAAFAWTDEAWGGLDLPSAVLYELHTGTFTPEGTFAAAAGRLDRLVDLGVTAIEIMPVHEFPGARGWGYDGALLYAPHHAYGGPEGLKALVDAAHNAGLGVILDVVYNHLGPAGNHLAEFGPYFTHRYATPWGAAVNLDGPGSDQVRAFFLDNARMWLRDYHVDGLRIDAVHALFDTAAVPFLEELSASVEALAAAVARPLFLIAESDRNDPRTVTDRAAGGLGMDAQWSDDFHHTLHTLLTGERTGYYEDFGTVADLASALTDVFVYAGRFSPHRDRRHGRPAGGLPGYRFLGYLQNHDQVGNRATGDRIAGLSSYARQRIGAAFVLLGPYIPMLFQGEEWAASAPFLYFTDHDDPDLGREVTEGRRAEFAYFGWRAEDVPDPQAEATFLASKLRWAESDGGEHAAMRRWYRDLLAIRAAHPALRSCDRSAVAVEFREDEWLVLDRGDVSVAATLGSAPATVPWRAARPSVPLRHSGGYALDGDSLHLKGDSVVVFGR